MKLNSDTSIFNMGDTSLRVKKQVDMYYLLLSHFNSFSYSNLTWKDKFFQEEFYKSIHKEIIRLKDEESISIFENYSRTYQIPKDNNIGKRGRTWTNALVKNGLLTSNRSISIVGRKYLDNSLKDADLLESFITLDKNNLLYLRQYLKLRIYSNNSINYFYNFRFAIKFLSKYTNVPRNNFLRIIESINPTLSLDDIEYIINDYIRVQNKQILFDDYYSFHFNNIMASQEQLNSARELFNRRDVSDELFNHCFHNQKGASQELYKAFVLNLIDLVDNRSDLAFIKIQNLSQEKAIQKAFGFNQPPFIFTKNENIDEFFKSNLDNPLLDNNHFKIYERFLVSKRYDLIREYSDMCVRSFQITGIFNFDNGLVNLNYQWLFNTILTYLGERFELCGSGCYKYYEENELSIWFDDITLTEILGLTDIEVQNILNDIKEQFNLSSDDIIETFFEKEKEKEYREFIKNKFPKDKVIQILSEINNRNDKEVFKLVTDNATIPTIYEYILTIAWYYISEKKDYLLHKSFQLTLDGDKLPLTHRGGGAGDIEIISNDYNLLIEATLMNPNNQKRAELEPVIRHSVNFKLQQENTNNTQSLFVANEIDINVLNIFRAMQFVELQGTLEKGSVNGLNIFALTTGDFIEILEKNITDKAILLKINNNLMTAPDFIKTEWYNPIRDSILLN